MKAELQNHLVQKYREFFQRELPIYTSNDTMEEIVENVKKLHDQKEMVIPIQFGIETGDGWFMLLDELMGAIQLHIQNENSNRDYRMKWKLGIWLQTFNFRHGYRYKLLGKLSKWAFMKMPRGVKHMHPINITQIKEKFGGLRFYYNGGDDYIDGLVAFAEDLSYKICEQCGTTTDVGQTQGWIAVCCKSCYDSNERLNRYKWIPTSENIWIRLQSKVNKHFKNG